jgi:glc operon protein GlcG
MRISIAFGFALGVLAFLAQDAAAQFIEKKVLTLAAARKMVAAAEAEAERHHLAGVVAVVDDGGWPILIERMDHAAYTASVELAPGKARTAALFKAERSARGCD